MKYRIMHDGVDSYRKHQEVEETVFRKDGIGRLVALGAIIPVVDVTDDAVVGPYIPCVPADGYTDDVVEIPPIEQVTPRPSRRRRARK